MLEDKVEEHLRKKALSVGGIAYKFVSPGRRNVPDRLFLREIPEEHRAIVAKYLSFIETKQNGGLRTFPKDAHERGQAREHKRLRDMGFRVEVIDSKEGVDGFMETLK